MCSLTDVFQFENIEKIVCFWWNLIGISIVCCLLSFCCLGPQFGSIHALGVGQLAGIPGREETHQADPDGRQGHHIVVGWWYWISLFHWHRYYVFLCPPFFFSLDWDYQDFFQIESPGFVVWGHSSVRSTHWGWVSWLGFQEEKEKKHTKRIAPEEKDITHVDPDPMLLVDDTGHCYIIVIDTVWFVALPPF